MHANKKPLVGFNQLFGIAESILHRLGWWVWPKKYSTRDGTREKLTPEWRIARKLDWDLAPPAPERHMIIRPIATDSALRVLTYREAHEICKGIKGTMGRRCITKKQAYPPTRELFWMMRL
jgi:hypothetical protein